MTFQIRWNLASHFLPAFRTLTIACLLHNACAGFSYIQYLSQNTPTRNSILDNHLYLPLKASTYQHSIVMAWRTA